MSSSVGSVQDGCDGRLHVMFGILDLADVYNQHVAVAITSVAENSSLPVTVHLLYDEEINRDKPEYCKNKERFSRLVDKYGLEIVYHSFTLPDCFTQKTYSWHHAMFLRLFAPDILHDVERVIYLDGDVVVNLDLAEVLKQEWWESYSLGACIDHVLIYRKDAIKRRRSVNVPLDHYFNSGVLFMNLYNIRDKYDLPSLAESMIIKYPDLPYPDQDILNTIFYDDVYILSNTYNNHLEFENETYFKHVITHYIGCGGKPWRDVSYAASWEYWKHLQLSGWCDSIEEYVSHISKAILLYPADKNILTGIIHPRKFLKNTLIRLIRELRGQKPDRW